MRMFRTATLGLLISALAASGLHAQSILAADTKTPFKISRTPGGNLVLAQGGTGANDGRITLVSLYGARYNLLAGLPSGLTQEGAALGPTSVADAHTTLYISIGEGDVQGPSAHPPVQVPNPNGPSSPIFSSVIRARFTPVPDAIRKGRGLATRPGRRDGRGGPRD
jgi:hypothetical protein